MKVAIQGFASDSGHQTRGIGSYAHNLIEAVKLMDKVDVQIFSKIDEVVDADVIHYPTFDLFRRSLPLRKKTPTVVTIHDLIPLLFPQHYPPGLKGLANFQLQKLSLQSVKQIITDSNCSRDDITKRLVVNSAKVTVIPLAASAIYKVIKDQSALTGIKKKYSLPDKFVVFVGSVNWNKNILAMAQASLKANCPLVMVGKDFESKDNLDHPERRTYRQFLAKFSGNSNIHLLGYVPDDDLVKIVNLAKALLLPSFYEGFGIPILDAQACGTPVITSIVSSPPEVAGKGALLVDPYNLDELSDAITRIINDLELVDSLVANGFKNVAKFSWNKTARETVKVYEKACKFK